MRPDEIPLEARLVQDLGLDGDDAIEALHEISEKCSIDLSGFDPWVYFRPEPTLLGLLRFLPSQRRMRAIPKSPLTVGQVIEAARNGRFASA